MSSGWIHLHGYPTDDRMWSDVIVNGACNHCSTLASAERCQQNAWWEDDCLRTPPLSSPLSRVTLADNVFLAAASVSFPPPYKRHASCSQWSRATTSYCSFPYLLAIMCLVFFPMQYAYCKLTPISMHSVTRVYHCKVMPANHRRPILAVCSVFSAQNKCVLG